MDEEIMDPVETEDVGSDVETDVDNQPVEAGAEESTSNNDYDVEAQAQQLADQKIASMNLVNHYTGEPIRSQADYDAFRSEQREERKRSVMTRMGWDQEDYDNFISGDPRVQEAENLQAQAKKAQEAAMMNEELKLIRKMDPSVKTVDDLLNHPSIHRVMDRCRKNPNLPVHESFQLENMQAIMSNASSAGAQRTFNSVQGRSHMRTTQGRGSGAMEVPAETMRLYRQLNPKATESEIRAHYNRRK